MYLVDDSVKEYISCEVEDKKWSLIFTKKQTLNRDKIKELIVEKMLRIELNESIDEIEQEIASIKSVKLKDEVVEFEYKKFICQEVTEDIEVEKQRIVEEAVEVEWEDGIVVEMRDKIEKYIEIEQRTKLQIEEIK